MSDKELEADIAKFWALGFQVVTDMEKRLFAFMAAHDLTPPQFYVLKTLTDYGGRCRIGQIASDHHLTNATMTGIIKRLESTTPALVLREQSPQDRRNVDVILTEEGKARFWAVQQNLLEQARAVFQLLPHQERQEAMEKVQFYFKLLAELFPIG